MELLCQLWTINEQITELRKRWESDVGNANNGDEDEEEDREGDMLTKGMSSEAAIPEVEEVELDGEEEFRMRNGGERSIEHNRGKGDLEHVQSTGTGTRIAKYTLG